MWFHVQHRPAGDAGAPALDACAPRWRTCLREIAFLDAPPRESAGAPALRGPDAYALVLEIICGLHSPIVGETQVLGQFRNFLASLTGADSQWLLSIGEQLVQDARRVREQYLRGVSSGSYGGEVRRLLHACEVIALIGRGKLASELRPYLDDCGRIDLWTREDLAGLTRRQAVPAPAGLVVAAPVPNAAIRFAAAHYAKLMRIVDLRAADERAPLELPAVITLDDLFARARESSIVSLERVAKARAQIRELAGAFEARQHVRPFGWEDLCA